MPWVKFEGDKFFHFRLRVEECKKICFCPIRAPFLDARAGCPAFIHHKRRNNRRVLGPLCSPAEMCESYPLHRKKR